MPIDNYLLEGMYEFNNVPIFLKGNMNVDTSGYLMLKILQYHYKNAEIAMWGTIQKIENIIELAVAENPINIDSKNIVLYLRNVSPSNDFEGTYYGYKFDEAKPKIPDKILRLKEKDIVNYIISEMDFHSEENGFPVMLKIKKVNEIIVDPKRNYP